MSSVGSTTELLNLLGDVKARVQDKLGVVDFPMPQFILLGKQSVGKSRLIETLAGETFNFISGTLGSRRPTVLEFRNMPSAVKSRWFVRNPANQQWEEQPINEVMRIVGVMHEECGNDVKAEPIWVRIESAGCVDMQIVDLPGFRDFALDEAKQALSTKIEQLVLSFMADKNNTMLCVEQANDAATMSSLQRCREFDPKFERTILIRNKLDKYYSDLTSDNVSAWVDGHGDLPEYLTRFALTLPFWKEGDQPPKPFRDMIDDKTMEDMNQMSQKGLNPKYMSSIGFKHFASFMEKKIEQMFVESISPVLTKLKDFKGTNAKDWTDLKTEFTETDPHRILSTTRECGVSFAKGLVFVMEGQLGLDYSVTLEEELQEFHQFHRTNDSFSKVPTQEFAGLGDYVEYLRDEAKLASFDVNLNGGAQFRRLMSEVEIFLRFSEIAVETKKRDVIQARGVSMSSLTWRDVVVKLLGNEAHLPLQRRVRYVGERIRWFFMSQKDAVLDWMTKLEGRDDKVFSMLLPQAAKIINQNEITKHLLYEAWDKACSRQLNHFLELFDNMLTSTFSNPWVFLKVATVGDGGLDDDLETIGDSVEKTKLRIPKEIESRAGTETLLAQWFNEIPTESSQIDDAVDKVQMLVLKTYSYIRSQMCDQVEIFSESFFKVPMLRQLEMDMAAIQLSDEDSSRYKARRERLETDIKGKQEVVTEIDDCINRIQNFKNTCQARGMRMGA